MPNIIVKTVLMTIRVVVGVRIHCLRGILRFSDIQEQEHICEHIRVDGSGIVWRKTELCWENFFENLAEL